MSTLYLVGAGPGDPDLITVKAIKALQQADVILFDALANEELLGYAKPTAIKTFVGKRYGCHPLSQQAINDLIISHGHRYKNIVRLKGGDPFVFGRAQEEIDAAVAAGMQIEIVPGISSALAVPASQMIPLTCRGVNESFWVVTGTTKEGDISSDIKLAAQSSATIILLMAMSKLEAITEIFVQYGKANTAAAIIQNGTRSDEKMVTGTVKDIYYRSLHAGLENPAVIIIGEVVNINKALKAQYVTGVKKDSELPFVTFNSYEIT
jgi:uroporphyrin-III C-methyltransferase